MIKVLREELRELWQEPSIVKWWDDSAIRLVDDPVGRVRFRIRTYLIVLKFAFGLVLLLSRHMLERMYFRVRLRVRLSILDRFGL